MSEYAKRDPRALNKAGGYFSRHMSAMTAENLCDKADIAAELAHRDREIERLRKALELGKFLEKEIG